MATPAYNLIHLKDGTPSPPAGDVNVKWQQSAPYNTTVTINNQVINVSAIDVSAYDPLMVGDSGSGGVAGNVPAPAAGDAAANKFLKADGTWETVSGGGGGLNGVNVQTGDYSILSGDNGKLVVLNSAAAHIFTLPNPPPSVTFAVFIAVYGGGTLTINRNSLTIDGASANIVLNSGTGLIIFTDGSNYFSDCNPTTLATKIDVQNQAYSYAADTGSANVYAAALSPAATSYVTGMRVAIKIAHTNTGASTLNLNTLGTKNIKIYKNDALADPAAGDLAANDILEMTYDGTQFLVSGKLSQQPYDIVFSPNFVMASSAEYRIWVAPRSVTLAADFAGSVGHAFVNPGSTQTLTVNKNGSSVGTISITSGGAFTFSTTSHIAVSFASGDWLSITNQGGADASMLVAVTFAGTR